MNNNAERQDRRFLHQLAEFRRQDGFRDEYEIAGHRWWCFGGAIDQDRDVLHLHIKGDGEQTRLLEVTADASGPGFRWSYTLMNGSGLYVSAGGTADTAVEACAAAVAFAPETATFDYLRETTWYSPRPNHWIAAIDGDKAAISCYRDNEYHWSRDYAPAAEVLTMTGRELTGYAGSLEEAMRAAIDAPDKFIRACAALVGGIRKANTEQ